MVSFFPGGIWNIVPGSGYTPADKWQDADVYANLGVAVPAHPSPANAGLEATSYLLADPNDIRAGIYYNNLSFALGVDVAQGYINNAAQLSQWWI